jgi:hypothetical protein
MVAKMVAWLDKVLVSLGGDGDSDAYDVIYGV